MNTRQDQTRTEWEITIARKPGWGTYNEYRRTEEAARSYVPPTGCTVLSIQQVTRRLDF